MLTESWLPKWARPASSKVDRKRRLLATGRYADEKDDRGATEDVSGSSKTGAEASGAKWVAAVPSDAGRVGGEASVAGDAAAAPSDAVDKTGYGRDLPPAVADTPVGSAQKRHIDGDGPSPSKKTKTQVSERVHPPNVPRRWASVEATKSLAERDWADVNGDEFD